MKNNLFVAFVIIFASLNAQSQVTFKPGIRAGANFSHFTEGDDYFYGGYYDENGNYVENGSSEFKSKTDFYVGFIGELKLSKYYTLQPEINYTRQGSKEEYKTAENVTFKRDISLSYISLGIMNKFTFNKVNLHIGPTLDIIVDKPRNLFYDDEYGDTSGATEIDFAFVAGLGFNITKDLGIEARIKKGIIPVFDTFDSNHTNVVFSIGAAYTFDIKESK